MVMQRVASPLQISQAQKSLRQQRQGGGLQQWISAGSSKAQSDGPPNSGTNASIGDYASFASRKEKEISGVPEEFEDIADRYRDRTENLQSLLKGFGDVQREALGQQRERALAGTQQSLVDRGLYNTTAKESAERGVESDYQRSQRALEDRLTRQQMDYMSALTGQELQARSAVPQSRMAVAQAGFGFGSRPHELDVRSSMQRESLSYGRGGGGSAKSATTAPLPAEYGLGGPPRYQPQTPTPSRQVTGLPTRAIQQRQTPSYAGMGGSQALQYAGSSYGF